MKKVLLICCLLPLANCATESRGFPIMAWSTPASVAFWFDPVLAKMGGPNQGHAAIKAQSYCQGYKKNARFSRTDKTESYTEVVFDCIDPIN